MKNLYVLAAALFCSSVYAQNQISFETSEGYQLGSINGQNSWQITDDGEGNFVENQLVSNEKSTSGIYSFKNGYTDAYGAQMFPIIGAQKEFDQPVDFNESTISFDVLVTETDGSNFEMAAYGINADDEYVPVFDLAFDYSGTLKVVSSVDYDMDDTGTEWQSNQWYSVVVKVSTNEIKYFIDGTLIYTTPNFTQINLLGMNFLHDNYGGDAYIDNIKINETNMSVSNVKKGNLAVYPNPVKNILNINAKKGLEIQSLEIYDTLGQLVIAKPNFEQTIDVSVLPSGTYFIKASTEKGSGSMKFVKQ